MTFTLASHRISRIRFYEPLDGVAKADVELVDGVALAGSALLVMGDIARQGVVSGAVVDGVGRYAWTAGAGLWETTIPPKGEQSAAGVLRNNVLSSLPIAIAAVTGGPTETVSVTLPDARLGGAGSAYVRPEGPAWHVLRALDVPWWIDRAGVTMIGYRPSKPAPIAEVDLLRREPKDGTWTVAPRDQAYAAWQPGNTLDGLPITSLLLEASAGEPIRLTVTTGDAYSGRTHRAALDKIIAQNTDILRFHGHYEYRVVSAVRDTSFGLRPVSTNIGLPDLSDRELRPGIPGFSAQLVRGQIVSVGFENGNPALPYVRAFEPRYKSMPNKLRIDAVTEVQLGDAALPVARMTDPIHSGSLSIVLGPPSPPAAAPSILITYVDQQGSVSSWAITAVGVSILSGPLTPVPINGEVGTPGQAKVFA